MVLILPEHSQRPYRYGMTLLCVGAMFNWLGLADNNAEPVRYIGVTLIAAGAMLICLAMCFWMKATHDPQVAALQAEQDAVHHIVTIHGSDSVLEKPPDYDSVTGSSPPSYEDAIKLNPAHLVPNNCRGNEGEDEGDGEVVKQVAAVTASQCGPSGEWTSPSGPCDVHVVTKLDGSSSDEGSHPDNFGTKVLRISRKLLRRTRSIQDIQDSRPPDSTEHNTLNRRTQDVSIR